MRRALEAALPTAALPPAAYSRQVCLDLLSAKQDSLDRGVPFAPPEPVLCERCAAVFGSLDLVTDLCRDLGDDDAALRDRLATLRERLTS